MIHPKNLISLLPKVRCGIICFLAIFIMGLHQAKAAKTYSWEWTDLDNMTWHYSITFDNWGQWHAMWTIFDAWGDKAGEGSFCGPGGGNPNPDDSNNVPDGYDPNQDPTGIKWAIEHGKIFVNPKESPVSSELFDFLEKNGANMGPASIWNPSEDGVGSVGPISGGGGSFEAVINKLLQSIKGGIPGSSGSGFIDAEGEFTGLPSSPSGGAGTGGGTGDGKGDGNTDRTANENGYFHDFSATDGLTIHPQADPAP